MQNSIHRHRHHHLQLEYNGHVLIVILMVSIMNMILVAASSSENGTMKIGVGMILDLQTVEGKMGRICISMALEDFYQTHNNYTTKIVPHFRDGDDDIVEAASAAIDLMKNVGVMAILGPQKSSQADFVIDIGNKSKVPVISSATSPLLSPKENPYFVRVAQSSSSQAQPIAALVKSFGWRQVVFVYEEGDFGLGPIPYLSDAMLNVDAQVKYRSVVSPRASYNWILQELHMLKTMQTRVFVVHMSPALASRFFKKVHEAGMMEKGYAWIITDVLTGLLHSLDPADIDSMQGVLGVKTYIPRSNELKEFEKRWKRRFRDENPEMDTAELDMFGIWSYDTIFALAMALERVGSEISTTFQRQGKPVTDLAAIGTSELGQKLIPRIRNVKFEGLSHDFHVADGQLQSSAYQVVNVIGKGEKLIGFWTMQNGISRKLIAINQQQDYTTDKNNLGAIIWPGDTPIVPRGWEIPTGSYKKLRVALPARDAFPQFINAETNPETKEVVLTGFCVDVFEAVMDALDYYVPFEFIPIQRAEDGNYNDLAYQVMLEKYDALVGDVTILANRSRYVDFTLPYTESGISMVVPIKPDERMNGWIFLKPLAMDLWITTGAFFIYTGVVVWILEHRVNEEFRGQPHQQVGMIFWFSFSTLVFAHKEKMTSNLSRFVVIVWVFVVLVLTISYTASLTSMLTVQQLQPTYTDIYELMRKGDYVGHQKGSFVADKLTQMGFDRNKLRNYKTFVEYDEALSNGSSKGGVSAIIDELPYLRVFLQKYCTKYTMVGPTYKTAGFGFAFTKGSPLVTDISRAILQVTETEMRNISRKWFGEEGSCVKQNGAADTSYRLTPDRFKGLFLIAGVSSTSALTIFLLKFFYENRKILTSEVSVRQKAAAIVRSFDEKKDQKLPDEPKRTGELIDEPADSMTAAVDDISVGDGTDNNPPSPATSIYHQAAGVFSNDEGFSATEPGTPVDDFQATQVFSHEEGFSATQPGTPFHSTIDIVETTIER